MGPDPSRTCPLCMEDINFVITVPTDVLAHHAANSSAITLMITNLQVISPGYFVYQKLFPWSDDFFFQNVPIDEVKLLASCTITWLTASQSSLSTGKPDMIAKHNLLLGGVSHSVIGWSKIVVGISHLQCIMNSRVGIFGVPKSTTTWRYSRQMQGLCTEAVYSLSQTGAVHRGCERVCHHKHA